MDKINIDEYKGNFYIGDFEGLDLNGVINLFKSKMNENSILCYSGDHHIDIIETREETDEEFNKRKVQVEKKIIDDEIKEKELFLKLLEKYGK